MQNNERKDVRQPEPAAQNTEARKPLTDEELAAIAAGHGTPPREPPGRGGSHAK